MTAAVLELQRVTYAYPGAPGGRPALAEVTLSVEAGELVVLAGASGSGKSTLLGIACGLVPHFRGGTFAGRARVAGLDTRLNGPAELSAHVGTVLQDPESQVVMGTVRAELGFGLENRGRPPAQVGRAVEEVALALGIEPLLDRPTGELSGGELQRVALAAALAGRPSLLVLDEPTSQLDPVAGDELIALLRRVNQDLDTTILLAEHRLERCLFAADRVLALEAGRIACDAPPAEFLTWAGRSAPRLQTPGARLLELAGLPPAAGVKAARSALRASGLLPDPAPAAEDEAAPRRRVGHRRRRGGKEPAPPALALEHVWHELRAGPVVLRDVDLTLSPRERVALMGANGAGKSTLLRHAAGLASPTRGRVRRSGRVALLMQNPNDYLVHETVAAEAPLSARAAAGLDEAGLAERHPRELSGGERQRLALAVVLGERPDQAAVVCLDEPTRGMDRDHRDVLASLLKATSAAVLVATHDPEFVAAFAQRVVLLGAGSVIADGPAHEVLPGGSYFAPETARILGGAGGALTPEQGAALLRQGTAAPRSPVPQEVAR